MEHRKFWTILLISIFSVSIIISGVAVSALNARATLINPRFGSPIRTSPTMGGSGVGELENSIQIWVGTDPADVAVPQRWLDLTNWKIGLSSSYLDQSPIVLLRILSVEKNVNPFVSEGAEDSSPINQNAIMLDVKIPGNISCGLNNLHVAYKTELGTIAPLITEGNYYGIRGSGNGGSDGFMLSEPNCVYIPSELDQTSVDPLDSEKNLFSLIHISDVHVISSTTGSLPENYDRLNALAQSLSVWAPDVIVPSGDLTNSPADNPGEYLYAYNYFRSLGIPIIPTLGNHDMKNGGLYPYYFGPLQQSNVWGGTRFITFNSMIPQSDSMIEWLVQNMKEGTENDESVFLVDHYPLMDANDREMTTSVGTVLDAMIKYNISGALNGHNHYNLIIDAGLAYDNYYSMGSIDTACAIPSNVGTSAPVLTGPQIFITSSASKDARYSIQESGLWENYQPYLGYRRITMANNAIINYTYDFDGDGIRDPSYNTPTNYSSFGGIECDLSYDSNNLMAGAQYTINNNLTEAIPYARAAITLPIIDGYQWMPVDSNMVVRTRAANATHEYLDVRVSVPAQSGDIPSSVNISLIPQLKEDL